MTDDPKKPFIFNPEADPRVAKIWETIPPEHREALRARVESLANEMRAKSESDPADAMLAAGTLTMRMAIDPSSEVYSDIAQRALELVSLGSSLNVINRLLNACEKSMNDGMPESEILALVLQTLLVNSNTAVDDANKARRELANIMDLVTPDMIRIKQNIRESLHATKQ